MRRDDSFLNTGVSSAADRRVEVQRQALRAKAEEEKGKLIPAADLILAYVEKEKTGVQDISSFVVDAQSTPEDIKSILLAKKMHLEFLTNFENKMKSLLRKKEHRND